MTLLLHRNKTSSSSLTQETEKLQQGKNSAITLVYRLKTTQKYKIKRKQKLYLGPWSWLSAQ